MPYIWLAFAALVLSFGTGLSGKAQARSCDTLIVTGNPEYPPLLWRDKNRPGKLRGAMVDLLREALSERGIGLDARYVGPWSRSQAEARMGRVDMLAGAFITRERQEYMSYVQPSVLDVANVVFVKKGRNFSLSSWDDLIGYQGDTLINNSFGESFDQFAAENLYIDGVRSIEFAFERLLLGRTDYVIYEEIQGSAIAESLGIADGLESLALPISSEGLYVTVSKSSDCHSEELLAYLNERVGRLVASGLVEQLSEESMGQWLEQYGRQPSNL